MSIEIGGFYYLKRFSVYHRCRVKSLHEYKNTAKVEYYASGEPVICRQSELLTEEQYWDLQKQRRLEARQNELRNDKQYQRLVQLWEQGITSGVEIATRLGINEYRASQKIACAKRWGLISDDNKPSVKSGAESSASSSQWASGLPADPGSV